MKGITAAVARLIVDERFSAAFRRDPRAACRRYRLTGTQIEALESGDARRLVAAGADLASLLSPEFLRVLFAPPALRGGAALPFDLETGRPLAARRPAASSAARAKPKRTRVARARS